MKKILFRKLLIDYLSFLFITLISTGIVIWVFQAVNFLDIMIEDGRDYWIYISYSLLSFPKILGKILPFVLFFSIFYVTIKYELNNELIIFWNFGINKTQIINFIFITSFFLFLFQVFMNSLVIPKSQDLARSFLRTSTINFLGNFIKQQKFNDTIKGVTIYSDKKQNKNNLNNIYIKKVINNEEFQITYAKKGVIREINNNPIIVLYDGATITSKNKKITNISFSKSDFSLKNLETNTTTYKKTQEISSAKIIRCIYRFYILNPGKLDNKKIDIENCTINNMRNILKEFYKRFIIPFYIPVLSLIPFILIISSKENNNYFKIRIITFALGFFTIVFSETTIRFISNNFIENIFICLIPIAYILFLYLYLFFKFNLQFQK